jgi:post-segregation antitoxin (ccd killing protein)
MTRTVVVRVDEELKRKAKAYNLNISEVVRAALRDEIEKRERRDLISALGRAKGALSSIPDERIVEMIREMRDDS